MWGILVVVVLLYNKYGLSDRGVLGHKVNSFIEWQI